jgi:citrate lyase gamma subunit
MNNGVPIREGENTRSKSPSCFTVGCLVIVGFWVVMGLVATCSSVISNNNSATSVESKPKTKDEQLKADRSNYAKAVKFHKARDFDNALKYLYAISDKYSGYAEVKRLIRINKSNKSKIESAVKKAVRKVYGEQLEQALLDQRMDTTVTVYGENYDKIKIKYILSSRVFANEFSKTELYSQIRDNGFRRIEIYGGLDDTTWSFDFD